MRRYVITGAPGTGKSALLEELSADFATVAEPARELLAEYRAAGREVPATSQFVAEILQRSIDKYRATEEIGDEPVIFDRAMPDCVAYAVHLGIDPAPAEAAAARFRYERDVFVAPVWEEIYTNDEERQMTLEQVANFDRAVIAAYSAGGYRLIELPRSSLADRAEFVRTHIG